MKKCCVLILLVILTSCTTMRESIKVPNEVEYVVNRTWDSVEFVGKIVDSGVQIVDKVLNAALQFGKEHPDIITILIGVGGGLML